MSDHVLEYTETVTEGLFEGTIIDVETDDFHGRPICFGSLHKQQLSILFLTQDTKDAWTSHSLAISEKTNALPRPFLAFNAEFEEQILSEFFNQPYTFDGELMLIRKSKDRHAKDLGAPDIPDPLEGRSIEVPSIWAAYLDTGEQEYLDRITLHNRACLLKECHIARQAGWRPRTTYALQTPRQITMKPKTPQQKQLLKALKKQIIVNITYLSRKGEGTRRSVAILSLGEQYFSGYCYLRQELRTFKIQRVTHLELTKKTINKEELERQLTTH